MPKQNVMNHLGHSTFDFSAADKVSLADAEARFAELTGKGFTAAKKTGDGTHEVIHAFDPGAEETLFFPHLQGG